MAPDFSGYVTKAGLKCTDGRMITPEAFKHQDKQRVPLVWQHGHGEATNILGYVDLEARHDGVYGHAFFNSTPSGQHAKAAVRHGDINKMSIYANQLKEAFVAGAKQVLHGSIREVSLVMAGANPGALIDPVSIRHSDGSTDELEDEAIIYTGLTLELKHSDNSSDYGEDEGMQHAEGDTGKTWNDIYDSLNQEQKDLLSYMVALAAEDAGSGSAAQSALSEDASPEEIFDNLDDQQKELVHAMLTEAISKTTDTVTADLTASFKDGTVVNVFDRASGGSGSELRHAEALEARSKFNKDAMEQVIADGERLGSLQESVLMHAQEYGIENIDLLFPDAKTDGNGVTLIARRTEWVAKVLGDTRHAPFSRIKSLHADITADEARAKGYVKGSLKKDEIIKLLRRVTTAKTIYKKQKLDRDDIIEITELDVVAWLKAEMRVMLDEELARAILIGDGRDADDEDKIDEAHIRPIAYDDDMYTIKVNLDANASEDDIVDAIVTAKNDYKGTGTPTLFTTQSMLTRLLLSRDNDRRRIYKDKNELSAAMLVADIIPVEVMEENGDVVAVLVNLADYTVGADKGGEVSMFDDFDIDFNQQKYLIETRVSGALTRPQSAVAIFVNSANILTPQAPTFVNSTGVLTIPNQTGVDYYNARTGAKLTSGAQAPINVGQTTEVEARPQAGYGLKHGQNRDWEFTRTA